MLRLTDSKERINTEVSGKKSFSLLNFIEDIDTKRIGRLNHLTN